MTKMLREVTYRARAFRRSATPAERLLWEHLRARRLDGVKFRRQVPLWRYFADFFSEEVGLVVEADGAHHVARPEHDRVRDAFFRTCGLAVLRLWNDEILGDTPRALERIRRAIRERLGH
jgi:very-short-patch-repair endonuclease